MDLSDAIYFRHCKFSKKAVLSQENRAMPQLLFLVETSPTTFTRPTSLRVAKLRKPGFIAPNIPAQKQFNAKWPF